MISKDNIFIPAFLKWAGGKRALLKDLDKYFPEKFNDYYEPFLGAGSVFFYIKQKYKPKKCFLSDINKDLINTYIHVRDKPELLIKHLKYFKKNNSEEFYYEMRKKFNLKKIRNVRRSALFIYLNKTCYNGLYRENSKGEFNVPFGKYNHPEIYNEKTILFASNLLKNVEIKHQDYNEIKNKIKKNDFIYLDPCYDPLKKTSFTQYTKNKFTLKDRDKLKMFINFCDEKKAILVLSNNDIPEVRNLYSNFNVFKILAPRFINSKSKGRCKITELVITNNLF